MTCPICGKPVPATGDPAASTVPFCSARCRMIDFSRWNDGRYAIVEPLDPTQLLEAAQGEIDEQLLSDE